MAEKADKEEIKEKKKIEKMQEIVDVLNEKLEHLQAEADHWKNEYYRSYADTKNLRNSLEKEHKEAIKYRAEGFIEELLPVLDSFYMALANEPTDPALKNYLIGFQYIYRNLVNVLEAEGVSEIEPVVGKVYDPTCMQALETKETDGEENIILEVKTKGYKLHDHLVRPAIVIVSKNKKEEAPTEKADA